MAVLRGRGDEARAQEGLVPGIVQGKKGLATSVLWKLPGVTLSLLLSPEPVTWRQRPRRPAEAVESTGHTLKRSQLIEADAEVTLPVRIVPKRQRKV